MAADKDEELFELVDEQDRVIGTEARSIVHKQGLLHRAVYCWVFDSAGRLLIQRRSDAKKIGPGQWDLSVAEHLSPGESYVQAVQRGLQEELGVRAGLDALAGPLAPTHRRELHEGAFHDVELVQSFRLDGWDAAVIIDPAEVADYKFVTLEELRADVQARPQMYTQWLREEAASLGWFSNLDSGTLRHNEQLGKHSPERARQQELHQRQSAQPSAVHDIYDALPF